MSAPFIQPSFTGGELSPNLYGRVDIAKFHVGLSTCRNMFVSYRGGAYSRAGTKFVNFSAQTGRSVPPRLIPFQFSINQGLALEFGNFYMRVISNGALVLENATTISAITNASPGVITDTAHGYSNGDWVYLLIQGMTQLNGQTLVVASATTNTYTLKDVYGNPINTATFGTFTSGTAARVYTLATPYAEADLKWLKFTQSADVMSLTCWNQDTGTSYAPYDLARLADDNWTITQLAIGAGISAPATCSGSATVVKTSGDYGPTDYQYVATAVSRTTGEESAASPIADIPNSIDIAISAGSINVNWGGVGGAGYYNIYKAPPAFKSKVPVGALFGYAGTAYGTSFVDNNIVPDFSQVPPLSTDPFAPGQITGVTITAGGSGLSKVTWAVTSGTGSGFNGYPIVVGGVLTAFFITNNGKNYSAGDSITFNGVGTASGTITFGANPTAGDTITLNGIVWTFTTTSSGTNTTVIQADLATTLGQLAIDLSAAGSASLLVAYYSVTDTLLSIVYKTPGTAGDAYTLAASVATVSGSTLTGGTGPSGAEAQGTYTFTVNPTASQNIILNGVTWTFVASGATGNQTNIGVDLATTLTSLASDLNASTNASIDVAGYAASATVLTITYGTPGTAGNAYTLAAGTYAGTVSGPTLTGGVNAPSSPSGTLTIGKATGTYPSAVAYFQQRRVYASSPNAPDTYWMSQPGNFKNFDARIPTIASDAITGTPWSQQVNGIQFMIPMPGGLVTLTGLSAWQLTGSGGSALNPQPITPASQQAQPQAYNGCSSHVPPIRINYDINYVQAKGSIYRDLAYNYWVNIYTGTDLTYLSSQLFTGHELLEMAWCEEPYKVIWATRDDGILLSLTYLKEQDVMGWARHDTAGQWWSVCSVTEPPVDALYLVSQRYLGIS